MIMAGHVQQRIPSVDVFKPNARVSRAFRGRIVGIFHRLGPDTWDDYEYRPEPGEILEILPGLRVQTEADWPRVRLHHHGEVVVVEWQPDNHDPVSIPPERRADFIRTYLGAEKNPPGRGAAAAIASLLRH